MDSVFYDHIYLIERNKRKIIKIEDDKIVAYHPDTNYRTGLAGDDLCGVFLCLKMLEHFPVLKAAFFVKEEEICKGSRKADKNFFKDVGYCVEFDAPGINRYSEWLGKIKIFDDDFNNIVKPVLEKYKIDNYSYDTYTDVLELKKSFGISCANLPAGYYNYHKSNEYVVISDVDKCMKLGKDFIKKLGNKKYICSI